MSKCVVSAVDNSQVDLADRNEMPSSNNNTELAKEVFTDDTPFVIHTDRINRKSIYTCSYPEEDYSVVESFKGHSTTQVYAMNGNIHTPGHLSAPISNVISGLQSDFLKNAAESLRTPVEVSENIKHAAGETYLNESPSYCGAREEEPVLVMTVLYDGGPCVPHKLLEGIELNETAKHCGSTPSSNELTINEQTSLEKAVDPGGEDMLPALSTFDIDVHFDTLSQAEDVEETNAFQKEQKEPECEELNLMSGAIKRSSSLISDSGIESEPSSVAWSDARSKALELPSDREILHHLVRRHVIHRNSLEGGHTESNTSLPSGIQASLTSISSLPYEEEEREVEPNKLTKSISAPQISSPEESLEDKDISKHAEGPYVEIRYGSTAAIGIISGCQDDRESDGSHVPTATNLKQNGRHSHLPEDSEGFSKIDCRLEGTRELDVLELNIGDTVNLNEHEEENNLHKSQSLYSADGKSFSNYEDPAPDFCYAIPSSSETVSKDISPKNSCGSSVTKDNFTLYSLETPAFQEIELDSRSGNESYCAEREKGELRFLANGHSVVPEVSVLESKKGVEVVNLSVSCTATCLPFSSVLKDSPPMTGFYSKQATSPITHQPVGSFAVISCEARNTDEETNERMLR